MFLGIEIGGTKLQFGIGSGRGGPLAVLERCMVDRSLGATGIRHQVNKVAGRLIQEHGVRGIGIGFGGPVDVATGRTIRSHQIDGWDDFPLTDWCHEHLGRPTVVGNDSDLAGLGEARFGAGRDAHVVFYSNVGSGIGGALVIGGELYLGGNGVASELGHLRPGPLAEGPDQTVESCSSGWGIAATAQRMLMETENRGAAALRQSCHGNVNQLTGKIVAEAYTDGNPLAQEIFHHGIRTYGWALAQMITLLAPNMVVIGGGVPMLGETLYLAPLRVEVDRYVYPPLAGTYRLVPAALGEEVVVHGALALAAGARSSAN